MDNNSEVVKVNEVVKVIKVSKIAKVSEVVKVVKVNNIVKFVNISKVVKVSQDVNVINVSKVVKVSQVVNVVQLSRVVKVVLTRCGRKRESGLGHLLVVEGGHKVRKRVEKEVRPRPSTRCGRRKKGRKTSQAEAI